MNLSQVNIAIIDDGVNEKLYQTGSLLYNLEIGDDLSMHQRADYDPFLPSHGTTCAAIIKKYSPDAVIGSIKILNQHSQKAGKAQLIHALNWCVDNGIRIVSMSLGTIDYRDFTEIERAVHHACDNGVIIVAACNNCNVFTCPASLDGAIGVKCETGGVLLEGEYIYNSFSADGIEITACARHSLVKFDGKSKKTSACNSFAAPGITAIVHNIIKDDPGKNLNDIKKILREKAVRPNEEVKARTFRSDGGLEAPVIVLHNHSNHDFDKRLTQKFRSDGYNAICIFANLNDSDFCNGYVSLEHFSERKAASLEQIILNISGIMDPDVILLSYNLPEDDQLLKTKDLEADLEIHLNESNDIQVTSTYGTSTFKRNTDNQLEQVYSYIIKLFEEDED